MERFTVRAGGVEIAAVRFGQGTPLLLAHPLLFSKAYYTAAAGVFGARFECVAFDQRGHGDTIGGSPDPIGMAGDIDAVLDHVGWARAAVGGTSLGALTTLLFAMRHPERVSLLVQDLPGFGPGTHRDPERSGRVAEALERADFDEAASRLTEGLSPGRAAAWRGALESDWRNYPASALGPKLAALLRATAGWRPFDRWPEDLARLRVPTRILALGGDPLHPLEVAQTMERAIPGARLTLRVASLNPDVMARQWVQAMSEGPG